MSVELEDSRKAFKFIFHDLILGKGQVFTPSVIPTDPGFKTKRNTRKTNNYGKEQRIAV